MTYQGKNANVSMITNKDEQGLVKAIREVVQPILDIKYSTVYKDKYLVEYTAIIITEAS